jgi:hypothetical protein
MIGYCPGGELNLKHLVFKDLMPKYSTLHITADLPENVEKFNFQKISLRGAFLGELLTWRFDTV